MGSQILAKMDFFGLKDVGSLCREIKKVFCEVLNFSSAQYNEQSQFGMLKATEFLDWLSWKLEIKVN